MGPFSHDAIASLVRTVRAYDGWEEGIVGEIVGGEWV